MGAFVLGSSLGRKHAWVRSSSFGLMGDGRPCSREVHWFSSFGIVFGTMAQKKGNSRTLEFAWVPTMHPHLQSALTSKANLVVLHFYCTASWHLGYLWNLPTPAR